MTRLFRTVAFLGLLIMVAPQTVAASSESERLNAFFQEVHEAAIARWPEWQTSLGLKTDYGLWNDRSEAKRIVELEIGIRNLSRLRHEFDYDKLDPDAKLSYRLFERGAERRIEWFPFRHHGYQVNHLGGVHKRVPSFLINHHRVSDRKDAEAYIARLEGVPRLIDQIIDRLVLRAGKGIIPPRFVFPQVLDDIDKILTGAPFETTGEDTAILADFRKKVSGIHLTPFDAQTLIAEAETALIAAVKPAYLRLRATMVELELQATTDDGAWKLPDGRDYYALALRSTTTTDLTPDEIHGYGLAEVARIHEEMRAIIDTMAFQGDLQAFFDFIRHDPANYFPDTDDGRAAYLADTQIFVDEIKASLDSYFSVKPKAKLVVKRVEPFREKSTNIGFYNRPSRYSDRPGTFYVNLHDMSLMPRSHLEGLAYHEAVPGHHMQIAIAMELEGLPEFRKLGGPTAYIEGWALYAERLAKEMGFYREPLSDFGRLAWELLRAARLVVDTGLHHKRWTREEAIVYLDRTLPVSHENNRKSIERYIVWPSQATAYKIGMREILALREEAKVQLGPSFDVRNFHDVVLKNGALPLDVLRELVDQWIVTGGG